MKLLKVIPFLFIGVTSLQAQVLEETEEIVEQEAEEVKKEVKEKAASNDFKDAQKAYEDAQKEYQDAQKALTEARQAEMKADNQLEKARMKVRQTKLQMNEEGKKANPVKIDRYEVHINPTYDDMSKGSQPGLATFIEGSETNSVFNVFSKNVDSEFKTYMKQFSSSKVKKQKGELFFDNIMIPEMSATTMDLFVDFDKQDNGVTIKTFYNNGSEFIDFQNESDFESSYAVRLMDQFARYIRTKHLKEEVSSLEKELEKNQKDLEANKKDISKIKEDVQKAKGEVTEKTNEISAYESAIDDLNDKLELTRKKLSKVN